MTYSTKLAATEQTPRPTAASAEVIIIGTGNSLRRDDGAGLVLSTELFEHLIALGMATRLILATQCMPEMAGEIAAPSVQCVIFVDVATTPPRSDFEIRRIDVDSPTASSGHHLSPATLLLYAALLYGSTPRAWMVTIPGFDFGHGEGFSRQVRQSLASVPLIAASLQQSIEDIQVCMS